MGWASMPFSERISYAPFVNNQEMIETDWDITFGDRKIELVFIGQKIDVDKVKQQLDSCLLSDNELIKWKKGQFDPISVNWPIPSSPMKVF